MRNGRYIFVVGVLLAAIFAADAFAAGTYKAHATKPSYGSSLELLGTGTYKSSAKRKTLTVKVCLDKRVGRRFFEVRCNSATGTSVKKVSAQVSVPGCVKGAWRTVVTGEAFDRNGALLDSSSATSRPYRCT